MKKGAFEPDTSYISKDTTINGNQFYVIEEPDFVYEGFTVTTKMYFSYSDSGMVMGRVHNGNFEDQILYRYPQPDGTYQDISYDQYLRNKLDDTYNVYTFIKSTDSLITTPVGKLRTYVFQNYKKRKRTGQPDSRSTYYFKEGIGIVRREYQPSGSYVTTSNLVETGNISELSNFPKSNE